MHGKGEYRVITCCHGGGSITLVHIEVNDQYFFNLVEVVFRMGSADHQIIKNAVARAVVKVGVMGTAS